ncbi:dicarboxylic acid transport [Klebsormidium nitens]|uniref:Amino acid transporter n=1 Tax=Klebsormidium nitens TaxID=105231 RepID=A0A1Y1IDL5_KLENI|nr:dicarboxylic acid transport [Klebsormidium nitens]|eukprot:GAQ87191.1 dicarboxylic acid transport [Klebsormidium nitens]
MAPLGPEKHDFPVFDTTNAKNAVERLDLTGKRRRYGPRTKKWMAFKKKLGRKENLIFFTIAGVSGGIAIGAGLYTSKPSPRAIELIGYPGELFLNGLSELVLPLVALALMCGVMSLRHTTSGAANIATWSMMYYFTSMFLAVSLGIGLVYAIQPGANEPFGNGDLTQCGKARNSTVTNSVGNSAGDAVASLLGLGRSMVPSNIVVAAYQNNYLGVMVFSIFFGAILITLGPMAEPLIKVIELANDTIMGMITLIIWLTPIGVGSLVAGFILKACNITAVLKALAKYVATVLSGFGIHMFVLLPLTCIGFSGINPIRVFKAFSPALFLGFGTASSAATMPVTMQNAEDFGAESSIVKFVVPLGTNFNRDGAALYEATSALFIAQAHGVKLSVGNVIVLAITATLAAIGSASIPNSAIVTLITVLRAVGLSEYVGDISVLIAVDWFLGMVRTVVNIFGDACAAVIVDNWSRRHEAWKIKNADKLYETDSDVEDGPPNDK